MRPMPDGRHRRNGTSLVRTSRLARSESPGPLRETSMRTLFPTVIAALALSLAAGSALARPYDAKALAHYDRSYVECEASFPEMKTHRDEAYLHLWRITPEDKSLARLAKLRADPAYVAEQKRVARAPKSASAPTSSALQRQCRGLWSEHQRAAETARRP